MMTEVRLNNEAVLQLSRITPRWKWMKVARETGLSMWSLPGVILFRGRRDGNNQADRQKLM